jgi:hypothetical protein
MTISVKHKFTSAKSDSADTSLVRPSNWNDEHNLTLASDTILGRDTAGTGAVEEITVSGGLEFTGSGGIQRSALTGDVTASAGSGTTTIANDAVTYAKMQNASTSDVVLGRASAGTGNIEEISCTAAGRALLDDADAAAQRTTLGAAASGAITGSGLTQTTSRILGRTTASTGAIEEISVGTGLTLSGGSISVTTNTYQPLDADLTAIAALSPALDNIIVGNGTAWIVESGATARSSLGAAGTGVTNTFTANQIVSVTDNTNAALRITQLGTGNALLVEDSTNPDATPTVVTADGTIVVGHTAALNTDNYAGTQITPKVQVQGINNETSTLSATAWAASTGGPQIALGKSRSATVGTNTIVQSGDTLGAVTFAGDDGTAIIIGASIVGESDGTPGTNDMPGRLVFSTTADGAQTVTERLRISSTGAFGISGANYGSANQVLISGGSAAAPSWSSGTFSGTSSGTNTGDQNIFQTIAVSGQSNVVADSTADTLTLAAGTNIAITTNATTDTITIATSGLGTAAIEGTGTSGATIPFCNGTNTWANTQTFNASSAIRVSGGTASTTGRVIIGDVSAGNNAATVGIETITTSTAARFHMSFKNGNGIVGSISTNASATAFNTSSDYRLKENIQPISNASHRVSLLNPVRFNWISDPGGPVVDGFIAHEVQSVVPEAITGQKDEVNPEDGKPLFQGIDQSKLVPLLAAALKEAIGEIANLKARVSALEGV